MKNKFVSIFTTIILSITSFTAFAKTEIIWWDLLGGGDGVKMAAMVEAFEKENPDIDVVNSTLEWGPPYYAKLQTSAAIGEQPDIAIYHLSRYSMGNAQGIFSPISEEELASVGVTSDQYEASIWEKASAEEDGYQLGLPLDNPLYVMHYNKDLFEQAGLLDENGMPTPLDGDNFDNFLAGLKKLKDITGEPPLSLNATSQYNLYWWGMNIIYQNNGVIWTPEGGWCPGDQCRLAFQFIADLINEGYLKRNVDWATTEGDFYAGRSAILIDGGWNLPTLVSAVRNNEIDFRYGAAKTPKLGPVNKQYLHSHTFIIPHSEVSPISDEKRKAVLRIMGWFSKNSLYWATAGHYLPHIPTVESPFFQQMWPNSGYADVGAVGFFEPSHPVFGIAGPTYDIMGNWLIGGVNGDISVEEAIEGAREEIEALM